MQEEINQTELTEAQVPMYPKRSAKTPQRYTPDDKIKRTQEKGSVEKNSSVQKIYHDPKDYMWESDGDDKIDEIEELAEKSVERDREEDTARDILKEVVAEPSLTEEQPRTDTTGEANPATLTFEEKRSEVVADYASTVNETIFVPVSGMKEDEEMRKSSVLCPMEVVTTSQLPIDAEESENLSNNESDLPKIQTYEEFKEEEKRLHEANDKELAEGVMNSITMKKTEMVEHLTIAENMKMDIAISEDPVEKKTSQVELGREESSSTSESIKKPVHQEIKSTVTVSSNVTKIPSRASTKPVATPLQTVINAVAINKSTPAPSKQAR